ncbi:MAG: hypothetical protein RLZZ292_640 [Bacteroidota bacterium]|jgi:hypothetical protein
MSQLTNFLNIDLHFARFFSVQCQHTFYKGQACKDLTFAPSEATAAWLNDMGMLFKVQPSGMIVLYNQKHTQRILEKSDDLAQTKLTFYIRSTNNYFHNFSEMPFLKGTHIQYFSNVEKNIEVNSTKEETTKFIHPKGYVETSSEIRFKLPLFEQTTSKAISLEEFQLIDGLGNKCDFINTDRDNKLKNTIHSFDLRHLPEGRYTLKAKGEPDVDFYLLLRPRLLFGVVEIFLQPKPNDYKIFDKSINFQEYTIRYKARDTYWKYIVIPHNPVALGKGEFVEVAILEEGEKIPFSKPQPHHIKVTEKNGFYVVSEKPRALQEGTTDNEKLELKLKKGDKWMMRSYKISKPGVAYLEFDEKTQRIFSTTIIYI